MSSKGDSGSSDKGSSGSSGKRGEQRERNWDEWFRSQPYISLWYSAAAWPFQFALFRRGLRAFRLMVIGGGLYQLGYVGAISDYARDPDAMEKKMYSSLLTGFDATETLSPLSFEHRRVAAVSANIIHAAQEWCAAQLKAAQARENVRGTKQEKAEWSDETQKWTEAVSRISGSWRTHVIQADIPNAFVSDICPKRIFVTTGFLKIVDPTKDELALILGHEISHVIHGHQEEAAGVQQGLLYFQLLLMAFIDPTGFLPWLATATAAKAAKAINMAQSREHEMQADSTGLQIAAAACYNVNQGVHVMQKFAELQNHHSTGWMDSHPSSDERLAALSKATTCISPQACEICASKRRVIAQGGVFSRTLLGIKPGL